MAQIVSVQSVSPATYSNAGDTVTISFKVDQSNAIIGAVALIGNSTPGLAQPVCTGMPAPPNWGVSCTMVYTVQPDVLYSGAWVDFYGNIETRPSPGGTPPRSSVIPYGSKATYVAPVITPPGAPTNVVATPGNAQASVSFNPPTNTGGAPISGYTVTSAPGNVSKTCASSPCVVTGLNNGTLYTFTVSATNSAGAGSSSTPSNGVTPLGNPPSTGPVNATVSYNSANNPITLAISGGTPSSVSISQAALHGSATASGTTISYTPAGGYAGTDSFTYTASNANGTSAPATVSVTITPPTITLTPASLPNATVGSSYSQNVSASGGAGPYTYSVLSGALPDGLTLASNGTLSGTPSASGNFNFTIAAHDSSTGTGPFTGSKAYALSVSPSPLSFDTALLVSGSAGEPYTQQIQVSGGTAPYVFSLVSGALPVGITLSSNGTLAGTPTSSGNSNFTVGVHDSSGGAGPYSSAKSFSIMVFAPAIVIAQATVADGTVGVGYSQSLTASGGTPAYNFAVTSGNLPSGITLSSSGVLSGTPSSGGTFNFTVTAKDANNFTGYRAYTLTVGAPTIALNPGALPPATGSSAYSQSISASGGTAPYAYTLTSGALPTGVTLSNTGTLSGTPTVSGSFNFTVGARDASTGNGPYSGSHAYTLIVNAPTIVLTPASVANATVGTAYSQSLNASGGAPVYNFAVTSGSLPAGITLSNTGVLSGTPSAGGTFNFTVTATDANNFTGNRAYTLTVDAATIVLNPGALPPATGGSAYSQSISASGGTAPYAYTLTSGALPNGITLSNSGTLSGSPTVSGSFNFTVGARDASTGSGPYSGSRAYTLIVNAPTIVLTPASIASATVGTAYSQSLTASGGASVSSFAVTSGSLPAGITLSNTGVLSGTPSAGGTFNFTVTATDANNFTGNRAYTLTVDAATIALNPGALPSATGGSAYSQSISASGGTAPYAYTLTSGALPTGITLSNTGTLSGTPTVSGSFNFTVGARDASTGSGPYSGSRAYTLIVNAPTIVLTPASVANATVGTAYSQSLTASGGTPTYTYAVTSGSLPAGITFSTAGALTGRPTQAGSFHFSVAAADVLGFTGAQEFVLDVAAPVLLPTIASGSLPAATGGTAYTQTFGATGGTPGYAFTLASGALPTGVTLGEDGVLSGTPTQAGTFNFSVKTTDSSTGAGAPFSITSAYVLTVGAPAITLTASGLQDATVGVAMSHALSAAGGTAPYAFSVQSGTLPAGVQLNTNGTLEGTPTVSGTFALTLLATDHYGFTGNLNLNLQVGRPSIVFAPVTLPAGRVDDVYSQTLAAQGGSAPYVFEVEAGTLPTGWVLHEDGTLSGTTQRAGSYDVTLKATDHFGSIGKQQFNIVVATANQVITGFVANPSAPVFAPNGVFELSATPGAASSPLVFSTISPGVCAVSGHTVTMVAAGNCVLFANQAADANYNAAPPVRLDVSIGLVTPEISWASDIRKIQGEDAFDLPMPKSTSPGAFTFTSSNAAVASVAGNRVTLHDHGTVVITAIQAAIGNFESARATLTLRIDARPDPAQDPSVRAGLQAQIDASQLFASAQQSNIRNRLRQLRASEGTPDSDDLTFTLSRRDGRAMALPLHLMRAANSSVANDIGTWTGGSIVLGQRSNRPGRDGYDLRSDGITVGTDRSFGDIVFGFALGTGWSRADFQEARSDQKSRYQSLALYGLWRGDAHWYLEGLYGFGRLDFDLTRWSQVANAAAVARRKGTQQFGSLSAGYTAHGDRIDLTGYARVDNTRTMLGAYRESGLGLYDLNYASMQSDSTQAAIGFEGGFNSKWNGKTLRPFWNAEYRKSVSGADTASVNYVVQPAVVDYLLTLRLREDVMWVLGAGLDFNMGRGWTGSALYRREQSNRQGNNVFGLQLKYQPTTP